MIFDSQLRELPQIQQTSDLLSEISAEFETPGGGAQHVDCQTDSQSLEAVRCEASLLTPHIDNFARLEVDRRRLVTSGHGIRLQAH